MLFHLNHTRYNNSHPPSLIVWSKKEILRRTTHPSRPQLKLSGGIQICQNTLVCTVLSVQLIHSPQFCCCWFSSDFVKSPPFCAVVDMEPSPCTNECTIVEPIVPFSALCWSLCLSRSVPHPAFFSWPFPFMICCQLILVIQYIWNGQPPQCVHHPLYA